MRFTGREPELALLKRFTRKKTASLIVVKGRRRIGKSRLIEEFAKPYRFYHFAGIPPTAKTTAQSQRNEFASQLAKQGVAHIKADDWNALFWLLSDQAKNGRVVILLDEISWMGSKDNDFLGKLKNAWDQHFKKNPQLLLILCGSASSWIEKNILSSTGFLGRVSQTLTLEELPLKDCQQFWGKQANHVCAQEKLSVLAVTGGIPRYLEEIDPTLSAQDNINHLCFTKGALLVDEFDHIFSNLFLKNSDKYRKLVALLASGAKEFRDICQACNQEASGRLLEYLEELVSSGFVKRDYTWHVKDGRDAKLSQFRLSDNYLRFYLKYIAKHKAKIAKNTMAFKGLSTLPHWHSIMGLQFENLVLNNRSYIWQQLGIYAQDIISENPFFQHKTSKQAGCQIDYLIQTKFSTLYICEIKFSKNLIASNVVAEMQTKIDTLKRPKSTSCRPVLIHVNGVDESLQNQDYFSHIIDFSQAIDTKA